MMIKLFLLINLTMSILLTMMKSPLKSNLIILFQSITMTTLINLNNKSSWISFMIFILYVSGLMIIFLYISSIAFNELNMNNKFKIKLTLKMMLSLTMILIMKPLLLFENFKFINNYLYEDNFYLINMFNLPNNLMIYLIMLILFIMLILIIWLLKTNKGPIRQKL